MINQRITTELRISDGEMNQIDPGQIGTAENLPEGGHENNF
jgi:hypothetical protein